MRVKIGKYPVWRWFNNWLYDKTGMAPEQYVDVQIDPWDTWNMDTTLAHIVVPMLKQLKATKHGYPSDLPNEAAWDDILNKMIFSFNSKLHDWESQFQSGEHDIEWIDNGDGTTTMERGPNDTFEIDMEGHKAYQARIDEGFALFGKYYENLWD